MFGYINILSEINKAVDICDLTTNQRIDVIALTESWHETSADSCFAGMCPDGFA